MLCPAQPDAAPSAPAVRAHTGNGKEVTVMAASDKHGRTAVSKDDASRIQSAAARDPESDSARSGFDSRAQSTADQSECTAGVGLLRAGRASMSPDQNETARPFLLTN